MGQFHRQKCPYCSASIETETILEYCPACKAYIADRFELSGEGTGISTANTKGPGLKPLGDNLIEDVY